MGDIYYSFSAQKAKRKRGGPGGLNKLCGVSPLLQPIVGHPTLPRTEVSLVNAHILWYIFLLLLNLLYLIQIVKQLWIYIRKNNLQDPSNKRKIVCNDELRLVFETDSTDMFKMNKLLAKHIIPLEPTSMFQFLVLRSIKGSLYLLYEKYTLRCLQSRQIEFPKNRRPVLNLKAKMILNVPMLFQL